MKSPIGVARSQLGVLLHLPGAGRLCINLSRDEAKDLGELILDAVKPVEARRCSYQYEGMAHKSYQWVCVGCGHMEGMGSRRDRPPSRICDQQEGTSL